MKRVLKLLALTLCLVFNANAQPNFVNDTPEWASIRNMNRQMCVLTKQTKWYSEVMERMAANARVHPNSISLNRLYYLGKGGVSSRGFSAENTCWGVFYTPTGVADCNVWFDKQGIIWRADCQEPFGKVCMNNDCRPLGR
jgi:hypothetical protein